MTETGPRSVSAAALTAELDAICASEAFRHAPQQQRMLRHLVARRDQAGAGALREMSLAIEVFQRPAASFDPRRDPIVRVEARRLRERLARYYAMEGHLAPFEIALPVGSYLPVLRLRAPPALPRSPANPAARALEERAQYVHRRRTIEGYRKALELFGQAIALEPEFAAAYRGLAWTRINIAGFDGVPPEAGRQKDPMRAAIETLARLDPDDDEVGALRAAYAARFDAAFAAAEGLYRTALERHGSSVSVRTSFAWHLVLTGRFAEARKLFESAYTSDPYGFWHRHNLGSQAYLCRDYATAERRLVEALEIEPDHAVVRLLLARVLMHNGRGEEAITHAEWCTRALGGMTGAELIHIMALARGGRRNAAIDAMDAFARDPRGRYVSPVYRAMACAALDEPRPALEWLGRAVDERDYWLLNVAVEPAFDPLRALPDFGRMLRAAGLPRVSFA